MKELTEYVDVTALSGLWHLHPESIRRLIRAGRLPAVRFGRRLRIGLEAVQAYESSQRVAANTCELRQTQNSVDDWREKPLQ